MAVGTNIPLLPVGNLPTVSVNWQNDKVLIIREGDSKLVKADLAELTQGQLHITPPPNSTTSSGSDGLVAVDSTGLYVTAESVWGKSPRYTSHWEDLTESTRFLLLDKRMNLTAIEKTNALSTLGITTATGTTLGLVKGSPSVAITADGALTVPDANARVAGITTKEGTGPAASTNYVKTKIAEATTSSIPVATPQVIGGIRASSTLAVSATGEATVPIAQAGNGKVGLVPLAPLDSFTPAQLGQAAPVALVQKIVAEATRAGAKVATAHAAGIVIPTGSIVIQDAESGTINVRVADAASYGTSKVITTIPSTTVTEPGVTASVEAIKSYVTAGQTGAGGLISHDRLPYASAGTRGAIISSATVKVNETGANVGQAYVPTASTTELGVVTISTIAGDLNPARTSSAFYITKQIADATAGVKNAAVQEATSRRPTANVNGLVRVVPAVGEMAATMDQVPTRNYMTSYVTTALSTVGKWDGGIVTNKSIFKKGLECPAVSTLTADVVLNYGQLQTLFTPETMSGVWRGGVMNNQCRFNGGLEVATVPAAEIVVASVFNHTQMTSHIATTLNKPTTTTAGLVKVYNPYTGELPVTPVSLDGNGRLVAYPPAIEYQMARSGQAGIVRVEALFSTNSGTPDWRHVQVGLSSGSDATAQLVLPLAGTFSDAGVVRVTVTTTPQYSDKYAERFYSMEANFSGGSTDYDSLRHGCRIPYATSSTPGVVRLTSNVSSVYSNDAYEAASSNAVAAALNVLRLQIEASSAGWQNAISGLQQQVSKIRSCTCR